MNVDPQLVEHLVRDVMQRLHASTERVRPERNNKNTLHLADRVVTGAILEEKLDDATHLQVDPRCVLTPSARELLARRGIEWSREAAGTNETPGRCSWLMISVTESPSVAAALDEIERTLAVRWQREAVASPNDAACRAVEAITNGTAAGVVVVTEAGASVACRANRNAAVRAAVAQDVAHVDRLRRDLGANVYCLDPAGRSTFEMRRLLQRITAGGAPVAPPDWKHSYVVGGMW